MTDNETTQSAPDENLIFKYLEFGMENPEPGCEDDSEKLEKIIADLRSLIDQADGVARRIPDITQECRWSRQEAWELSKKIRDLLGEQKPSKVEPSGTSAPQSAEDDIASHDAPVEF